MRLEDIAWYFVAERFREIGGMILQKETYELIYKEDLFEDFYKEEDMYIEFGKTFETIHWVQTLRVNLGLNDLLSEAIVILEELNNTLFESTGSEIFEDARMVIKDTVLIDIVTKIRVIQDPNNPGKMKDEIFSPEIEKIIPIIKNFLKSL